MCHIDMAATRFSMLPVHYMETSLEKVVMNGITATSFHLRKNFELSSARNFNLSVQPCIYTAWHLYKSSYSEKGLALCVEARDRNSGKRDNGEDKVPQFGPQFVNGSGGTNCPVPSEQLPVNEYQSLLDSMFFSWAVEDVQRYILNLSTIGAGVTVLLGWPIVSLSINPEEDFIKCGIGALCGGLLAVTLTALRLYLGWAYIGNRLLSATVEYEETGWYDGEMWVKSPEVLARDRLLGCYKVKPALNRVRLTLLALAMSLVTCTLFFLKPEGPLTSASSNLKNYNDTIEQSYGIPGLYSDASAHMFEPEAFEGEDGQPSLPDYCY